MTNQNKTLSLKREAKRILADGRYVTRGTPINGGWASIYKATDTDTGNTVAVKILNTGKMVDEIIYESFHREVTALADLQHQNIVQILDSGCDEDSGDYFIVIEWVENNLLQYCENHKFSSWDDFFNIIGRPILDALSFAHSHSTAHRDIKPTNILISNEGKIKVCDFGISKIRNFLMPGVTLAQYASLPFAPPEMDDGSYSYSRDVFGFAVLTIYLMTGSNPSTYEEVMSGLEKLSIDESIKRVLRSCLIIDEPDLRPQNAVMLQAALEKALLPLRKELEPIILLIATNKVLNVIESDLGITGGAIHGFLEKDLSNPIGENIPASPQYTSWAIKIYGVKYRYTLVPDEDGTRLKLVDALSFTSSELEWCRQKASSINAKFAFFGNSNESSGDAIISIRENLLKFDSEQKILKLQEKEQLIFKNWLNLLNAMGDLEKSRKIRVHYTDFSVSGELLKLTPKKNSGATALLHQDIIIEAKRSGHFCGTVVSASDREILIRPSDTNRISSSSILEEGIVETDTKKTDLSLDRQRLALDAVRYDRSVNPNLRKNIVNPNDVIVPEIKEVEFIQKEIDEDKKDAVLTALSGPELMIVEGPPGTGKTTFITELVLQTFISNPHARVLLTSQTHVALDNSLERIMKSANGGLNAVRIGNDSDPRISDSTKKYLLDAKLPEMRKTALSSGRAFIERWADLNNINVKEIQRAMALERFAGLKQRLEIVVNKLMELSEKVSDEYRNKLEITAREEFDEVYQELSKERGELSKELKVAFLNLKEYVDSEDELEEFSKCSVEDLRGWAEAFSVNTTLAKQLKEILLTHADWEARLGRSREFRSAVIASSQIVAGTCLGVGNIPGRNEIIYDLCIVDEASIATPTQVLVPMSRARRTILVGDNKQLSPFQDPELKKSGLLKKYNLNSESQKETLFKHLSDNLPSQLCKALTTQHRMLPQIGDLVAECFYPNKLFSVDREPAPHLKNILPNPVVWYSTSRATEHESKKIGKTYYNDTEVKYIVKLLERINFYVQKGKFKNQVSSVAILTGYSEQRERLQTAVETKRHNWNSFSEVFINVVDAFQGREADIVIFSVTRSEEKTLGFLSEMERINVALSRGKELLIIVGDHLYCQNIGGQKNPLRDVLGYITSNSSSCTLEEIQ
ncbi:serine/threonine-protein kinase [Pectobacterium carotovorum]|uniref:serine/threonine-protein kinase n=1 Tax=Pectobacterium carotovorum TaxID=554 RepID=UPI002083D5EB|nr:serine/threonine-protein kinase [Pectobacterium carotovorum]GKV88784.1 hypothetical protein PEC301619_07660 [Pectobacterium carotovorum subsp. carotovorum]